MASDKKMAPFSAGPFSRLIVVMVSFDDDGSVAMMAMPALVPMPTVIIMMMMPSIVTLDDGCFRARERRRNQCKRCGCGKYVKKSFHNRLL